MHILHYIHRWLAADPPGTNHLVAAVIGVALVWIVFERLGAGPSRSR
ncbi:MAG TPA: hypothetical protein VHC22_22875 [Pirellulales bacterium]|nr:hypothetical protein [Pirellulales bacterium]